MDSARRAVRIRESRSKPTSPATAALPAAKPCEMTNATPTTLPTEGDEGLVEAPGQPGAGHALLGWIDTAAVTVDPADPRSDHVDWQRIIPFVALHLGCLLVLWTGTSPTALGVAPALYVARMFAITAFYHRYFSHRTFRTSRAGAVPVRARRQLGGPARPALVGRPPPAAPQALRHSPRLPLAAPHGPPLEPHAAGSRRGATSATDLRQVPRPRALPRAALPRPLRRAGPRRCWRRSCSRSARARHVAPGARHDRLAAARLGLLRLDDRCCSTAPSTINSPRPRLRPAPLRHAATTAATTSSWRCSPSARAGTTTTTSIPASARQGFYWWELDLTYYGLRALAALGLIWDLRRCRRMSSPGTARPSALTRWRATSPVPQRIAIVGIGHRRPVRRARVLARRHDVTVFEADDRVGGHTHTDPTRARTAARCRSTPASSSSTTGPTRTSSACSTSSASPRSRAT